KHLVPAIWKKAWVVHSKHAASGNKVLEYLGRYVFRIAITNSRIESVSDGQVVFRYRNKTRGLTHAAGDALRRRIPRTLIQHVLPRGCTKVRYYGIFSPRCQSQRHRAAAMLPSPPAKAADPSSHSAPTLPRCPLCKIGNLIRLAVIAPQRIRSP